MAFGEPPDLGAMHPANGPGASTRPTRPTRPSVSPRRPRRRRRRRGGASGTAWRTAPHSIHEDGWLGGVPPVGPGADVAARRTFLYWRSLRSSRGIRVAAWTLVAAGIAAPVLASAAPTAPGWWCWGPRWPRRWPCVPVVPRRRARDVGGVRAEHVGLPGRLQDAPRRPGALRGAGSGTSITLLRYDRVLGLGATPTSAPAARRSPRPGSINRFERVLVWCHWMWFAVPHASVGYVLAARPRPVPERGGADVRRVRHRSGVLLVDTDRAALVGGRATGAWRTARQPACAG